MFARLKRLIDHLSTGFGGGPRVVPLWWVINAQKGGTALVYLLMAWAYGASGPAVWTLIALHGSYGVVWLLKEATLPDPGWRRRVTPASAGIAFLAVLGPYWVIGWVLLSGWSVGVQSPPVLAGITALHTVGVALMIGADAQKTAVLRARPGLITDGFFARIRHPNYLGEMMIYGSYALIVWHWLPAVILGCIWGGVFLPNILAKEARLARHPGWEAYEARTGLLWPKL